MRPAVTARLPVRTARTALASVTALAVAGVLCLDGGSARAQSRRDSAAPAAAKTERELRLEAELRRAKRKLVNDYCERLAHTSAWAAQRGLLEEARAIAGDIAGLRPEAGALSKLRAYIDSREPAGEDADLDELRSDLERRRERDDERHAKKLFDLGVKCFEAGLFSHSYDLLREVLELASGRRSRHQRLARRALGYVWDRESKTWITEWKAKKKRTHFLTEEGWIPKRDRDKWEEGLRPYKGKWVSVERERQIRNRNEYNPYRVETEHFIVKSNLGRKEAWKYARILEDFNQAFYRVFIGFYDQVAGAKLLFKRGDPKKHEVYVFPSREDYLIHVKAEQGNSELARESAGFYNHSDRVSRFYWTEDFDSTLNTLYHEVAHQLFAETKPNRSGSSQGNNWVVEGIAVYCETWEKVDGEWRPGARTEAPELQRAQGFLASTSEASWSLEDFVRIDHDEFHEENRGLHYALAGALCHFFIHYDDGALRDDFVRFLSAYYAGNVQRDSLLEYLSDTALRDFDALEERFREYIASL